MIVAALHRSPQELERPDGASCRTPSRRCLDASPRMSISRPLRAWAAAATATRDKHQRTIEYIDSERPAHRIAGFVDRPVPAQIDVLRDGARRTIPLFTFACFSVSTPLWRQPPCPNHLKH